MPREVSDFINSFLEYTEEFKAATEFREWGAVCAIAGALEMKTFVRTAQGTVYPHLYTIFMADSGSGKTRITRLVSALWQELEKSGQHIAPTSVSKASLMDCLYEANRSINMPEIGPFSFNSLKVLANEMQVLLPKHETEFMSALTDVWDCEGYAERKRSVKGGETIKIPRPQLNLLLGTTPSSLNSDLPEGAFDRGFMSRCILLYAPDSPFKTFFSTIESDEVLYKKLVKTLLHIGNLRGEFSFTAEAKDTITAWEIAGHKPRPTHPKLIGYNTRRIIQVIKLCQIACVAEQDKLVITKEHFYRALRWLFIAEGNMPKGFSAMTYSSDDVLQELYFFLVTKAGGNPNAQIGEDIVVRYLQSRCPPHAISYLLEGLVKARYAERIDVPGTGGKQKAYKLIKQKMPEKTKDKT